jgi:hypothetical protein
MGTRGHAEHSLAGLVKDLFHVLIHRPRLATAMSSSP